MDLGTFRVREAIVHEVPNTGAGPILSEAASHMDNDLRHYFERQIVTALGSGFPVVRDEDTTSPVPERLVDFFDGTLGLIAASTECARHLFSCQTGAASPGLLTVLSGEVDGDPCISLLKLEKLSGARVRRLGAQGHQSFDIERVRELMLTDDTRVFKVGLFPTCDTAEDLEGLVCDNQRGYRARVEVAAYFLGRFLGCKLEESPEVTTKPWLVWAWWWSPGA